MYVNHFERLDLFITFTCNPKWLEIVFLKQSQKPQDRYDIVVRVFDIKLKHMMKILIYFALPDVTCTPGKKRGLSYIRILLRQEVKIRSESTDKIISVVVPVSDPDHALHDPSIQE